MCGIHRLQVYLQHKGPGMRGFDLFVVTCSLNKLLNDCVYWASIFQWFETQWRHYNDLFQKSPHAALPSKPQVTGVPELPPRGERKPPPSRRVVPTPPPSHQSKPTPDYMQDPRKSLPQRLKQPAPRSATLDRCANKKLAKSLIKDWEANIQDQV